MEPSQSAPDTPANKPHGGVGGADAWAAVRAHLEAQRRAVLRQIAQYPPPITACDAQFNHLLELRDGLAAELRRLEALADGSNRADALAAFVADCPYLDAAARERLTATGPA
jgi:hypothetical protein